MDLKAEMKKEVKGGKKGKGGSPRMIAMKKVKANC